MNKVSAVIVLYKPNEKLLFRLLKSLSNTVDILCVVDNTPLSEIEFVTKSWFSKNVFNVNYLPLNDNYGIATAQNKGIEYAIENGCTHVILFDQDSEACEDMVKRLLSAEKSLLEKGIKVGAIGPVFIDEKTNEYSPAIRHHYFYRSRIKIDTTPNEPVLADYIIASGALIRTSVLNEVGFMKDVLFIDQVDVDWALRACSYGYKNYMVSNVIMKHSIGDNVIVFKSTAVKIHTDLRHFYLIRNICYLLLLKDIPFNWKTCMVLKIPQYIIFYSITAKKPWGSFKLLIKASINGFRGKLGKYTI